MIYPRMEELPESININFVNVKSALTAKITALKAAKAAALSSDVEIDEKTMQKLTSFNVTLKDMMFNGRAVNALYSIDETSKVEAMGKLVFVKVTKEVKGRNIMFYLVQQSVGECSWTAIAG